MESGAHRHQGPPHPGHDERRVDHRLRDRPPHPRLHRPAEPRHEGRGEGPQYPPHAAMILDCAGGAENGTTVTTRGFAANLRRRFRRAEIGGRKRISPQKAASESGTTFLTARSANSPTCGLKQQGVTARTASSRSPKYTGARLLRLL